MTRRLSFSFLDRWPAVNECAPAVSWLMMQENLGLAHGTVTVYARSLDSYLLVCGEMGINPLQANQGDVARWIRQDSERYRMQPCNCDWSIRHLEKAKLEEIGWAGRI